jgi:hypothetical protein
MHTIPDDQPIAPSVDTAVVGSGSETLHAVLASQARDRTKLELWAGAVIGGTNAALIWARFPSLHWLAAGFAAAASYGAWGLIDRKLTDLDQSLERAPYSKILMLFTRILAGALGWACALFAIGAFLTAALGGLSIPGR